jgi:ABC-type sulfate/molybdate transport systems ATPase subunit
MGAPVYRLERIGFAYPRASASSFSLALGSLEAGEGEILALVGPNGAGKTTLLSLLALLARPQRGRLEFLGRDPWASDESAAQARRFAVLLTHHPYLFRGTVGDNVAFGLRLRRLPEAGIEARVAEALSLVELDGWQGKTAAGLSAGQAQRVALARALALEPRALLLDEPTANLDAALGLRMESVLREAARARGTAVIFSSHNFSQASRLADSILYLSDGRRVEFGHENCFSGTVSSDGRTNWIEPKPGLRIVFAGQARGHVTCVIDPAEIRVARLRPDEGTASGPNVFRGRVSRMEATDETTALVRTSGDLVFRATLPVRDLEAARISLSTEVLLTFEPGSVRVVGERPAGPTKPS